MKLIYHSIDNSNDVSPFDKEIIQIVNNQNIYVVSPYISLEYLKKITSLSKSWKLITDFNEWILSHKNQKQREDIFEFIRKNKKSIKHIDNIHAKVIITNTLGLIGSANFTDMGIRIRDEMAVSISEKEIIEELQSWFYSLWSNAIDYSIKEVNNFINQNKNLNTLVISKIEFKSNQKNLRNTNYYLINRIENIKELELIETIRYMNKNRDWINKYLDIIKELFLELNIQEDSLKISMSTSNRLRMPISVGQRYVIRPPYRNEDKLGLILPLEFEEYISNYPNADIDDKFFFKNKTKNAHWIRFDSNIIFSNDVLLFDFWKESVKKELFKSKKTGFYRSHNPYYYKIVMDLEYRNKILNETIN